MKVYPLWHISHQNEAGPNDETMHLDDGGVFIDEQDGDDVKLLGIYSSEAAAEKRMRRARHLQGFIDEPDCFQIGEYDLDEDHWTEGFVRVPVEVVGRASLQGRPFSPHR